MYQIYADGTLIYDSTLDEYKIGKGSITLETNKSGSFEFSLYPDHFYYDKFVRMKTVIVVYKSGKIVFRGRVLSDVTDYWNKKVITCEGELGFLQDSIIRPFNFTGTPEELFRKFITEHNQQVDDFKRFKIGKVTVTDPNNTITRSNSEYETAFDNLNSRLIEDSLGGYFYITHENEEEAPTLNYLIDFETVSSQAIEFGVNLKNYTKTINAGDIATAIIPLGATIDDGNSNTDDPRLTIASVNNGVDYVYNAEAVALRGWIFKTVVFDDVTVASNLKAKGEEYLQSIVNQAVTIELNAIDLHLLDHDIESFRVGDYIEVLSEPHNFNATMLCNKQTIDLLKPENDTVTLGHNYSVFSESTVKSAKQNIVKLATIDKTAKIANKTATTALVEVEILKETGGADLTEVYTLINQNALDIVSNKNDIEANSSNIVDILSRLTALENAETLPYTLLNYIESTGTQYIDTGISVPFTVDATLQGVKDTGGSSVVFTMGGNTNAGGWFGFASEKWMLGGASSFSNKYSEKVAVHLSWGSSTVTASITGVVKSASGSVSGTLLVGSPKSNFPASCKIFELKIYDSSETLVRNFVPAKNSSGTVGLYDKVNNQFYTNAGTGEFIGG